ncbi:hypothetical protein FOCG_18577 [Fusarium oxysporum f. sp. radicis-lycopersici 26381]|nr:hypothetical protein FOCG_18577 [Fusarium oxysporum f. sp. radicis-lycopersici 26381]
MSECLANDSHPNIAMARNTPMLSMYLLLSLIMTAGTTWCQRPNESPSFPLPTFGFVSLPGGRHVLANQYRNDERSGSSFIFIPCLSAAILSFMFTKGEPLSQ